MASRKQAQDWLRSSKLTLQKCILIALGVYFVVLGFWKFGGQSFVYNRIINPLQFKIRNQIFKNAEINPNLKILAVDQGTLKSIGLESVSIDDWIALFKALARAKPKAVFIDKMFSMPLSSDPIKNKQLAEAISSVNNFTAGAIYSPAEIPGLNILQNNYVSQNFSNIKKTNEIVYGPNSTVAHAFDFVGFANIEDFGKIRPVINTEKQGAFVHWGLFAGALEVRGSDVFVDGKNIYLDENNQITVNMLSLDAYTRKTYAMSQVFQAVRQSKGIKFDADDIVIILNGMHQGATNYRETPAGSIPVSYIMVEVVNSALEGRWLRQVGHEPYWIPLFCVLGVLIAYVFSSTLFWIILLLSEIVIAAVGVIAFCYAGVVLPWAFQAMALFLTGVAVYIEKIRLSDKKAQAIQLSLEGMIEPTKLKNIVDQAESFKIEPQNQILTVMFIDIAGFSALAEKESPVQVFDHVRSLMTSISDTVHRHGGIIDRSLGDGLLCFFGYQFEEANQSDLGHALQAVKCAVEIQKNALARGLSALKNNSPIFPLRIGLNTGEVYAGDIGGSRKIDFTIIGHAVNFAQRMESACENYKIMCGASVLESIHEESDLKELFVEKYISVKHYPSLVKAYEVDPFLNEEQSQRDCENLKRAFDQNSRKEERFDAPESWQFFVYSDDGLEGRVINFSKSGLEVEFNRYLGRNATVHLHFKIQNKPLSDELQNLYLDGLAVEVRWALKVAEGRYRTGLKFKSLSESQREMFLKKCQVLTPDTLRKQ